MSLGGISNLDYAVLLCNRMDETRAFYRDIIMKFPIENRPSELGQFSRRRSTADAAAARKSGGVCDDGKSVPGSAAIQMALSASRPPAVDACHAELVEKGVPILRGPTDLPDWRHRTLFFRDPEDNIIEIYAECGASPSFGGLLAAPRRHAARWRGPEFRGRGSRLDSPGFASKRLRRNDEGSYQPSSLSAVTPGWARIQSREVRVGDALSRAAGCGRSALAHRCVAAGNIPAGAIALQAYRVTWIVGLSPCRRSCQYHRGRENQPGQCCA